MRLWSKWLLPEPRFKSHIAHLDPEDVSSTLPTPAVARQWQVRDGSAMPRVKRRWGLFDLTVASGCLLQTIACHDGRNASETAIKLYFGSHWIWKVSRPLLLRVTTKILLNYHCRLFNFYTGVFRLDTEAICWKLWKTEQLHITN